MLILSVLMVVSYVGVSVIKNKELPDSISALVYGLPRAWQWVWIVWMWAVSLTTCIPLIEAMPDGLQWIAFAALCCLMFCGAMPITFKEQHTAHNILGTAGGILLQVCVLILNWRWLLLWVIFVILMGKSTLPDQDLPKCLDGKGVTVAEVFCYVATMGCLIIHFN